MSALTRKWSRNSKIQAQRIVQTNFIMHVSASNGQNGRRRGCKIQSKSRMSSNHDSARSPSTQRDRRQFSNDLWRPSAPSRRAARRWKSVNDDKTECWTSSSCHERVRGSCSTGCISRSPISENQLNNECVCNQSLKCLGYDSAFTLYSNVFSSIFTLI